MIIDLGDTRETPTKENRNPAPRPGPRNIAVLTSELRGVLKLANNDGSKIFEQLLSLTMKTSTKPATVGRAALSRWNAGFRGERAWR